MLSVDFCARNDVSTRALADMCTMGIGGSATLVTLDCAADSMYLREHPYRMLGKGANLLITDAAITETVVRLGRDFAHCEITTSRTGTGLVRVGAAYDLARCVAKCARAGYAGPEGLAGVPARIGGALYMNAGTSTCCIFDWVSRVEVLLPDETQSRWLLRDEVPARYRSCGLPVGTLFLQCEMELQMADSLELRATATRLKHAKATSQPLSARSAGCVFKNPSSDIGAGWLIDNLELKGHKVGDAMVSEQHANFIVNTGAASAADVCTLIQHIRTRAWQQRGIALELEVQCWDCPPELHTPIKGLC